MEHESHHNHHPHGTGTRWLDLTLAIAATIVSLVSLWLGLHSSHSMERLVTANSYPYLESNRNTADLSTPISRRAIDYFFENNGSGPARIDWVQLTFKGKPVADLSALLEACCGYKVADVGIVNRRGDLGHPLVRPGAMLRMFTWTESATPNPAFDALHGKMDDIKLSACYCSVFDECYIQHDDNNKPEQVPECKAPTVPFHPGFRNDYR